MMRAQRKAWNQADGPDVRVTSGNTGFPQHAVANSQSVVPVFDAGRKMAGEVISSTNSEVPTIVESVRESADDRSETTADLSCPAALRLTETKGCRAK